MINRYLNFLKKDSTLWDNKAAGYSAGLAKLPQDNWYYSLVQKLIAELPKKGTILDFGCGDGSFAEELLKRGYDVIGIDASKKMVEIGRKKFPDLDLRCLDIMRDCPAEKSFDCVVCNMVLHDIKNIVPVVEKLISLVRKNGKIIFSIPHPCFYTARSKKYFDGKSNLLEIEKYKSLEIFYYFNNEFQQGVRIYRRTLTNYFHLFLSRGFVLVSFEEIFKKENKSEIPFAALFVFKKSATRF